MKLIKFYAHGFKSFADPIQLSFDGGVVGIIGPNGSGKSNINDAIKWVLGEQSSKMLRGESMEDVIFAGSQKVRPLDRAIVTLTFDNRARSVSLPHDEIRITRELERGDGKNKYYINDELVRYKDIKDIVLESGISKSSLAIISQGTVSDIAEATPESRRLIFEEAAGVSKYRARKVESLRKLEKTAESLAQIQTVINELDKQLKPLRTQAEKAKIYLEKSRELKAVEVAVLVHNLTYFKEKLAEYEKQLEGVKETRENLESQISRSEQSLKQNSSDRLAHENDLQKIGKELDEINAGLKDLEVIFATESQRRQLIISGQLQATTEEKKNAIREQISAKQASFNFYAEQRAEFARRIDEKRIESAEKDRLINDLRILQAKEIKKLNEARTKISILEEHRKNKTNLFRGVKTVMEHKNIFKGYHGLVSDLLDVPEEYHLAIEAALGNALQHIVVNDSDTAVQAINFLKQNDAGRATFIPLKSISAKSVRREHEMAISNIDGFVGVASKLFKIDPKLNVLLEFLLGNIIFTDDIKSAKNIDEMLEHRYMIVTLYGDIIRAGGVMTGGTPQASTSLIGIDEQIEKLQAAIPLIEQEENSLINQISIADSQRQNIVTLISQLTIEQTKINIAYENDENALNQLRAEYETISSEKLEVEASTEVTDRIHSLQARKTNLEIDKRTKQERVLSLNTEHYRLTNEKLEWEKSLRTLNNAFSKVITEKDRAEFILSSNHKRLSEYYNMTLEVAQSNYKLEMDLEEAEAIISKLQASIRDLGHVNVEAIQQFEQISERFDELKVAENEIIETKVRIEEAIKEMDKIIIERMRLTLDEIGGEFNNVFREMFGGGQASVHYVDESNPLESGIDIKAQPPGKSIKNLRLFSGGEKSLIAISLLFAILKSRPLALCILDEVEAALDEANVVRYADYLQELKPKTQFLVITHRHGTMSRVDHLFGATMQTRGVTSFFTVKIEDAKKMVEDTQVIEN
ncbi:AAA family ATPase [Mycoplasmopsis agassizii]|uniref:Chromosome partition protein Smc n=1 Tax=Mycoplasmopsis agassizii TaxID=33922 RepID=A0ABX4H4U0_9BACT|nr:AAA family ATPase [Mycoplasmopsis agassizii]PAF54904.1 ABC transporter ATP-binding protein [Mycoplasmopsis agassizii]SMC17225.1 condensin subunit Smc [Mycoplasmopsis agassizii]